MTDRDHFAAAALTGLLVHANDGIDEEALDTPSDIAYTAYAMADAMLRERERREPKTLNSGVYGPEWHAAVPNLDAAPAARAAPSESSAPLGKGLGTGDTQEPVACSLTLTDAEREALKAAWCDYADAARMHHKPTRQEIAATLRGLLERLGGGR